MKRRPRFFPKPIIPSAPNHRELGTLSKETDKEQITWVWIDFGAPNSSTCLNTLLQTRGEEI